MPHRRQHTGIYCIENKLNGKKYIGQAYNIERRLYEHKYHLAKGTDHSGVLQKAANKYGLECFEFYILEECELESMNEREIFWINYYQTNNSNFGYNLSRGGETSLLGHKFPPEFGREISKRNKGKVASEKTKEKMSMAQKGRIVSEETKKKISDSLSGENHYMWGKRHLKSTKKKMSESHSREKAYQFGTKNPDSGSQYFGVIRNNQKHGTYYIASVKIAGTRTYIGSSKIEIEAARMYDAYVLEHNLPNPLNFGEE